jgi:hypothetical protein
MRSFAAALRALLRKTNFLLKTISRTLSYPLFALLQDVAEKAFPEYEKQSKDA